MTIEEVLSFEEMQIFDRKSINIEPKALAIPLVAFANADGGTIAVGISDKTRRIEGVDFEVQKYNELLRVPFDFCNPTIPVQIEKVPCVDYQGRKNHVLLIHIEPSPQVHTNQADEAYLRVGDKSKLLKFDERLQLTYDKGERHFEDKIVPDAGIDDINLDLVKNYIDKIGYSKTPLEYLKQNKESEVLIMLHVEMKALRSQTALGYEIPGEYDSDYSKSGAYWNHINFKEYPAYPEGIHDYGEVGLWTHPDHISGELHYFFGFLTDSTEIPDGFHKVEIPAGRYAIFTIKSQETPEKVADAVRDGWRYVFTEWLCTQKEYKISHQGMCFECYQGEEAYLYLPVIDL